MDPKVDCSSRKKYRNKVYVTTTIDVLGIWFL